MSFQYSVLMSVYDKEHPAFLKDSIDSMLGQSVFPADFVLVCDGPLTKELNNVIDTFQKQFPNLFQIVHLKENMGLGPALNIGLSHCKFDIVARMDSDDIAMPCRIELQAAALQHNSADIVSGTVIEFNRIIGDCNTRRIVPEHHNQIRRFAKRRNPFNHPCVMFKKEAVQHVGGYQPFYLLEDYYLWIRLLSAGYRGYNVQQPLLYMRVGNGMYSRRGGLSYFITIINLRKYMVRVHFCSLADALYSIVLYGFSCIIPSSFRKFLYMRLLRK